MHCIYSDDSDWTHTVLLSTVVQPSAFTGGCVCSDGQGVQEPFRQSIPRMARL